MKTLLYFTFFLLILACEKKETATKVTASEKPKITDLGKTITFGDNRVDFLKFKTERALNEKLAADFSAPARVVACVIKDIENKEYNMILFNEPDLTANFSMFLERLVNIRTYQINVDRVKDLFSKGAATGKDVMESQTQLHNEEAAIIENEARFLLAGLEPDALKSAKSGISWVICDIPEDQVNKLKIGSSCNLNFTAYEDETFVGKIEDIGEVVDNITRMVKLRILVDNSSKKLKAGMFANIKFSISEDNELLCVSKDAIVTVQGKEYVFVKSAPNRFERREIMTGQQINDRVIIFKGVGSGEEVVSEGVMQLKGLSFGY